MSRSRIRKTCPDCGGKTQKGKIEGRKREISCTRCDWKEEVSARPRVKPVVIPEEEPDVTRDKAVEAIQTPGTYVLQAGSFSEQSDADRRRAELALLGIESRIQRISIDDRTYHRVRIGPMNDLDELNLLRAQLRQAGIDALRIRLGD